MSTLRPGDRLRVNGERCILLEIENAEGFCCLLAFDNPQPAHADSGFERVGLYQQSKFKYRASLVGMHVEQWDQRANKRVELQTLPVTQAPSAPARGLKAADADTGGIELADDAARRGDTYRT